MVGSVGKLMPHMQVKFGENDEILLKGPAITKGYYKKEAATKAAFTEDGWFRTGDAGYIKEGFLFLTERIKDLFKTLRLIFKVLVNSPFAMLNGSGSSVNFLICS